jgi:diguanylate cyclase (GGDEF)-like protein
MNKNSPPRDILEKHKITKFLIENEAIMNWNILQKCILMLILGAAVHVTWIIWKVSVLLMPNLWQWVDLPLLKLQLGINIVFLVLMLLLIYPCYALKNRPWAHVLLPYVSVGLFVVSLCRDGYIIGVLSPATMTAYVSLVTVGLVLFPRAIVYSAFIPATIFLTGCMFLSQLGYIPYSPVFHIHSYYFNNAFWLISMAFFIAPILVTCLVLFEILLSQWRYRERLIKKLSQIDPLTNLFNRRQINQCLDQIVQEHEENYALVLLDLDHFKFINDDYGHDKGDETLVRVAEVLNMHLRDSDVVGRFGGEEFILILHKSNLEQATQAAERCRTAIQALEIYSNDGERIHVTASFGIAISQAELRPQQLLSQADKALYEAKASGRNQVKTFTLKTQPDTATASL